MVYIFKKSTRKGKKYDVWKDGVYLVSFGSKYYQQFKDKTPIKAWKHLDHNDPKRKANYYSRFGRDADFESAKYFSHKFLW